MKQKKTTQAHKSPFPIKRIGSLAEIFTGLSLSGRSIGAKNDGNTTIRLISISDLNGELGRVENEGLKDFKVESVNKIRRYMVEPNDVLISCRGTTTKVALFTGNDHPTAISSNLISIRPGPELKHLYLLAFLQSTQGQQALKEKERGMFQKALTVTDIESIEVPVPPIEIQRRIVELLDVANEAYRLAVEVAESREKIAYEIFSRYLSGKLILEV